jgi:hypothetical protein
MNCWTACDLYKQTLLEEIQNAIFVLIQANETTGISYMSEIVICNMLNVIAQLKYFISLLKLKIAQQKV